MITTLLGDRVLFKKPEIPKNEEKTTASGIVVPGTENKRIYWETTVDVVGTGVKEEVKPGDKIVYIIGTANDIEIDGEEYQFISSAGIIAIK